MSLLAQKILLNTVVIRFTGVNTHIKCTSRGEKSSYSYRRSEVDLFNLYIHMFSSSQITQVRMFRNFFEQWSIVYSLYPYKAGHSDVAATGSPANSLPFDLQPPPGDIREFPSNQVAGQYSVKRKLVAKLCLSFLYMHIHMVKHLGSVNSQGPVFYRQVRGEQLV